MLARQVLPAAFGVITLVIMLAVSTPSDAATSNAVVSASVLPATMLDVTGCPTNTAGITNFGPVAVGSSTVTSADCVVAFGSSNDSSMLRLSQQDGSGRAFVHDGWSPQTSGSSSRIHDISALDDQNAIAVGTSERIYRTTNGGTTWVLQSPGSASLYGVFQFDATHAWAVGAAGRVLATTNGTVWAAQTSGTAAAINGVAATSTLNAWFVTDGGEIRTTVDGGANWTIQRAATGIRLTDIIAVGPAELFAVGANGTILHTVDGGATWPAQASGTATQIRAIDSASPTTLWASGNNGLLLATTNGGATWAAQASGTTANLNALAALTPLTAVAVGDVGAARQTDDGGATWAASTLTTADDLEGADYANGRAWIVADNGAIFASPDYDIPDYAFGVNDWDQGPNAFGACLRASSGTGATAGWTTDANADCTTVDGDPWNPIPTSAAAGGAVVLRGTTAAATDLVARLRFGFRASATQRSGLYQARLAFSVVAPNG